MSGASRQVPRLRKDASRFRVRWWVAAVAAVGSLVIAPSTSAHEGAPMWSLPLVMSRIDGARVTIGKWSRREQIASTLCSGEGHGKRWTGLRHWRHFACTWTVFDQRKGVDRDVTFRVHTLTATRFLITSAHFGSS